MSLRPGLGATYRLQLRPDFGFADAARIVPYLARLRIETLYLSPIAEAVPHSAHGYDGTDPTRLRVELGGDAGYDSLVAACERHELGICVDHVPNHLATWPGGGWWRQLLAEGPGSEMAEVFDVDWEAGDGKVVLPMLDGPLDAAIADGSVRSGTRDGQPVVCVGELDLPVAAGTEAADLGADFGAALGAQHYRLADWHDPDGRNFRRFFDIDGLVGVRLEDPTVLARTQALVIELARSGRVSALRIDHIDGLRRPTEYLSWLSSETGVPIVVEKILTGDERLRADWPVVGTTGYETIDDIGGVLVDAHGLDRLVAAGRAEGDSPVEALTVETRRLVAGTSFSAEVRTSATRLGVDPEPLRNVVTRLTRYRTYLDTTRAPARTDEGAGSALWHELDETAVWRSLRTHDGTTAEDEVVDILLEPAQRPEALRVQQLTGALMAKGVEDTAWYRLAGPLAFCEVGGDPARRRHDALERWHDRMSGRAARRAHGLVPGTTHDTKHSQDVRSRLYAVSEMADPFEEGLRVLRTELGIAEGGGDLSFETRVAAQLALGVLPPLDGEPAPRDAGSTASPVAERLGDALVKGAREAKLRSSWTAPDQAYEARLRDLAGQLLADRGAVLHRSFGPVLDEALRLGALNSLTSVVLRHTLPGVPDCYQGDEVWNLSLVDPDNRRPVDLEAMSDALDSLGSDDRAEGAHGVDRADVAELRRSWRDGRVKLHVTASCLRARRGPGAAALAADAHYVRLGASGPAAGCLLTYARHATSASGAGSWAVVVVSRLGGRLDAVGDDLPAGPSYEGTVIPLPEDAPEVFSDAICGHRVVVRDQVLEVEDALVSLPVALLVAGPG